MQTSVNTLITKSVDFEKYVNFGLELGLKNKWLKYDSYILKNLSVCEVFINFDGLPIYKSSGSLLWLISFSIAQLQDEPFIVDSYFGSKEPKSIELYLENYINEASYLTIHGFVVNEKNIKFTIY